MRCLDKSQKIISLYISKLSELKETLYEKDKIVNKYEKVMLEIYSLKNKLKTIYLIMELKLSNIQSTKNYENYEEILEKTVNVSLKYKEIFNKIIDDMKDNLSLFSSLKVSIEKKIKRLLLK